MAKTYYLNDANSSNVTDGSDFNKQMGDTLPSQVAHAKTNIGGGTTDLVSHTYTNIVGEPNQTSWPSGDYIARVYITTLGANVTYKVAICRVDSAGALVSTLATSPSQTVVGSLYSFTHNLASPLSVNAGDRLQVRILVSRAASHGTQTLENTVGNSSNQARLETPISVPITGARVEAMALTDSQSASVITSASVSEAMALSDSRDRFFVPQILEVVSGVTAEGTSHTFNLATNGTLTAGEILLLFITSDGGLPSPTIGTPEMRPIASSNGANIGSAWYIRQINGGEPTVSSALTSSTSCQFSYVSIRVSEGALPWADDRQGSSSATIPNPTEVINGNEELEVLFYDVLFLFSNDLFNPFVGWEEVETVTTGTHSVQLQVIPKRFSAFEKWDYSGAQTGASAQEHYRYRGGLYYPKRRFLTPPSFIEPWSNGGRSIGDSFEQPFQDIQIQAGVIERVSNSFLGNGHKIKTFRLTFREQNLDPPSNIDVQCHIYAHSGTYGTSSVPTGSPLASSNIVNMAQVVPQLGRTSRSPYTFTFNTPYQSSVDEQLVMVVQFTINNAGDELLLMRVSTNVDTGNIAYFDGTTWTPNSAQGLGVYYEYEIGSEQVSEDLNLTDTTATTLATNADNSEDLNLGDSQTASVIHSASVSEDLNLTDSQSGIVTPVILEVTSGKTAYGTSHSFNLPVSSLNEGELIIIVANFISGTTIGSITSPQMRSVGGLGGSPQFASHVWMRYVDTTEPSTTNALNSTINCEISYIAFRVSQGALPFYSDRRGESGVVPSPPNIVMGNQAHNVLVTHFLGREASLTLPNGVNAGFTHIASVNSATTDNICIYGQYTKRAFSANESWDMGDIDGSSGNYIGSTLCFYFPNALTPPVTVEPFPANDGRAWGSSRCLHYGDGYVVEDGVITKVSQSFLGNGGKIKRVTFHFRKHVTLGKDVRVVAKLYSHSGTYGTSSVPNEGNLLATSDEIDLNFVGFASDARSPYKFTFATPYQSSVDEQLVVVLEATFDTATHGFVVSKPNTASGTDSGNSASYNGSVWTTTTEGLGLIYETESGAEAVSEDLNLTDSQSSSNSTSGANAEDLNLTDTQSGSNATNSDNQEDLNLSDSQTASILHDVDISEDLNLTDEQNASSAIGVERNEAINLSDSQSATVITLAEVQEDLNLTDSQDPSGSTFNVSRSEAIALTDTKNATTGTEEERLEDLNLQDSQDASADYHVSTPEAINLSDSSNGSTGSEESVVEDLNLGDTCSASVFTSASVSESISLSDSQSSQNLIPVLVSEAIALTDTQASSAEFNVAVSESVSLQDVRNAIGAYNVAVAEVITFLDVSDGAFNLIRVPVPYLSKAKIINEMVKGSVANTLKTGKIETEMKKGKIDNELYYPDFNLEFP